MGIARQGIVKVLWNTKDVSTEVQSYLSSVTFTDHEEGAADECEFTFDNESGIWSNDWYPVQGDTLHVYIGYDGSLMDCGLFEVDEITLSGTPDVIEVKAISAGFTTALRSRNNKAFEAQTLKQIAKYFCKKHGLTLVDDTNMLSQINLERKTQENETDLHFLSEIAKEYGFLFSIKGTKLVFVSYYALDNANAIKDVDKSTISSYSFTEKCYDTYAAGKISKRNPKTGKNVQWNAKNVLTSKQTDVALFSGHVSNTKQAEAKVAGGLWNKNKFKQTGTLSGLIGDPELRAGVNFNSTGFGLASGKYHITTATHTVDGNGGYLMDLEIRKTGTVPKPKRVPKTSTKTTKSTKDIAFESLGEDNTEEKSE